MKAATVDQVAPGVVGQQEPSHVALVAEGLLAEGLDQQVLPLLQAGQHLEQLPPLAHHGEGAGHWPPGPHLLQHLLEPAQVMLEVLCELAHRKHLLIAGLHREAAVVWRDIPLIL